MLLQTVAALMRALAPRDPRIICECPAMFAESSQIEHLKSPRFVRGSAARGALVFRFELGDKRGRTAEVRQKPVTWVVGFVDPVRPVDVARRPRRQTAFAEPIVLLPPFAAVPAPAIDGLLSSALLCRVVSVAAFWAVCVMVNAVKSFQNAYF